ncbi:recombinase family protein [Nocardia speluncae]|uniref:Recombinase family protein n=1 Tax=Nocardia speluncae TaxID=419477 RepID=A0A846XIT5_9NOCA|nr:recombinase family protein [Nocardia speluncae]NKY35427.1 recombinase family protein [Nocardia speluncae]
MARVVGRLRISRATEESTSLERQEELIQQWADMHGHVVVGWAVDRDVSGSVDPFDTKGLGPWLTDTGSDKYDLLVGWKLDRFGRRVIPLNKLFGWCLDHNKALVCISDQIDLSNWIGRLVANVIAGVAEGELEAIAERSSASRAKLLKLGRFPGGAVPYGFQKYRADVGWKLKAHPEHSKIVRRIVNEIISGKSVSEVAHDLTEDKVPTATGKKSRWESMTLWQITESKTLLGYATYKGEVVRDDQGEPAMLAEPLITLDEWNRLQAARERRRNPNTKRTRSASPLLGVAKCATCGGNFTHMDHNKEGKNYRYYRCTKNHPDHKQIPAKQIEDLLEEMFIDELGEYELEERRWVSASNHTEELNSAREAVAELSAVMEGIKSRGARDTLIKQITALDSKIATLEELPVTEAHWEYIPTGKTWGQVFRAADWSERRKTLTDAGITVDVKIEGQKGASGAWYANVIIPVDLLERLHIGSTEEHNKRREVRAEEIRKSLGIGN